MQRRLFHRVVPSLVAVAAGLLGTATAAATPGAVACRIVSDPAGDATLTSHQPVSTPDDAPLDVLSADLASGSRNVTIVVRVAGLGTAVEAGPRLDQWVVYFTFRDHGFAATAARAVDGEQFWVAGDFPEKEAAPGFTATVPVGGSFDPATNEIRIVLPRDLIGHTRSGDKVSRISVDTLTGVGTLATQSTGAYAGRTVDRTQQPGPTTSIGAPSCVKST
jgi:hypothetical protein